MADRILRINQLIKKELAEILLKEFDSPKGSLITITKVETFANLSQSKIYVSIIFIGKERPDVISILKKKTYSFQKSLDRRLKMRKIPKITFFQEEETAQAAKIEEILFNLRYKK